MIQLWAEVYDPTYTTQIANSDIKLISASVDRVLDGVGRVSVETSVLHVDFTSRALGILTNKRVVEVWYQENARETKRRVASFVIERVKYHNDQGGLRLTIAGSDTLSLLLNDTTSLGLSYDNQTISDIIDDLLPSGWSTTKSGIVGSITARFDGTSILKALQEIMKNTGFHFRQDATEFKRLIFSEFGSDSGYRIVKIEGDKPLTARGSDVIPLETIDIDTDSSEMVNKIIPLSAGDGDSRGTLEDSNKSSPYTIQTETGPDGRTIYYLSDSSSVATYGTIEKVLNFKKIAPIGVSDTAQQRTANYLYDGASKWLDRHKDPLTSINVRTKQQRVNFSVGDKVTVEYIDQVVIAGTPITLKSINDLYWVMSARESYGADGENATLELASVDRTQGDLSDQLVEAVDAVDIYATGYKATYNIWSVGPITGYISYVTDPISYYLNIPADVLKVENVTLVVNTYGARQVTIPSTPFAFSIGAFALNGTFPKIDIDVNSTSVASAIGSTSSALTNYEIDVTDEILGAGSDGRGDHLIEITGNDGTGEIGVQFLIRGQIIPGRVV